MEKYGFFVLSVALSLGVQASWYWPFGSNDDLEEVEPPRISELIEPASELIDEAADLAAEGKADEAIEKYRKALGELDRIEMENPDRAKGTEFATVRNKRAYVNAAIDSMLLSQVKANAKAVSVSDTTELEKRLAAEKGKVVTNAVPKVEKPKPTKAKVKAKKPKAEKTKAEPVAEQPKRPLTKREQAMADIERGDYAAAELTINEMLVANPNGAMALNLKAAIEVRQGKFKDAERTLDQAIMSNPRNYFAYYNMANLLLRVNPAGKAAAKRYYETGRAMGGPENERLEAMFQ